MVTAWAGEQLVGVARVLSDECVQSALYDLVVDPEFQNVGIGKEIVRRCAARFPDTEWLVQATKDSFRHFTKLEMGKQAGTPIK